MLDAQVKGKTWIIGDALTLCDLSLASTMMYAKAARPPLEGCPNLLARFAGVQAHDASRATEPPAVG